jgi:hypothetical protein
MKTRLISTTLVILFAALTVGGATINRIQNSSAASSHENATEQNITNLNFVYPSEETTLMQEWIDSRNEWEQTGQSLATNDFVKDSEMLEEWISTRDNWEKDDQELVSENFNGKSSLLEEWIASTANWEQR